MLKIIIPMSVILHKAKVVISQKYHSFERSVVRSDK